jgi:NHL repeat
MKFVRLWLAALLALVIMGILFSGCGEKIAIPQPKGLFSISAYLDAGDPFEMNDPRQLVVVQGALFVINQDSLSRRNLGFGLTDGVEAVTSLVDPISLCGDADLGLVFVYEQDNSNLSWYSTSDLALQGSTLLPDVQTAVSMATCPTGIEQVSGGLTFLYLADPDSGVVHRYAFEGGDGGPTTVSPYGILTRSNGQSARFVHEAAGMARDHEDSLLVCDADAERNWVIRFFSEPDLTDTTPDEDDQDPLRGRAAQFRTLPCEPQPAASYVLGDAPQCDESGWVGGPSDAEGEFDFPQGVAVDGSGRIFVTDTRNSRVQIFNEGAYEFGFVIDPEIDYRPTSIAVVDKNVDPTLTHYGAYVFIVLPEENFVRKYISFEEYQRLNPGTPPPPQ